MKPLKKIDENVIQTFNLLLEDRLKSDKGKYWLNSAHARLLTDLHNDKFNTDRALEVYTISLERTVLAYTKGKVGYYEMITMREAGIISKRAAELVAKFKETTGAVDQRPIRTGLRAKIFGK